MSRLGDTIRTQRERHGMALKELAKRTGMSEKFLLDVEMGSRILGEQAAQRILKVIGEKPDQLMEDFSGEPEREPAPAKRTQPKGSSVSEVWQNALGGVVRRVPVMDVKLVNTGYLTMAVEDGKIAGAAAEKVFYLIVPDQRMQGFRIRKGDRLLVAPEHELKDNAIVLVDNKGENFLAKVKRTGDKIMLMQYEHELHTLRIEVEQIKIIGRCVRVEFDLK